MKVIPTKIHGILDYAVSAILIASPWIFKFSDIHPAMEVPIALGILTILYSMFTDYEYGLFKKIPMRVHLLLDVLSALLLAASPWIFGFANYVYLPHLLFGILEMVVIAMSDSTPYRSPGTVMNRNI
jgi:hypothetical protein